MLVLSIIVGVSVFISLLVAIFTFKFSSTVTTQLKEMSGSLEAYKSLSTSLSGATSVFGEVQKSLGRLEEANRQICELGKNISTIQELLRAPKFRGKMGETLLENILSQVLPKEFISTQYRFKTQDTVDAVIRLGTRIVPIDAKFPLENFQKLQEMTSEEEKNTYRKKFIQDVKLRIDEIAKKYILPGENTYDFAMMYVPAENVYYEIIIKEDLLSFALSKKVIPVSPNTFYAYLQVICLGLKGLEVEKNAMQILKNLSMLSIEINKFKDDFSLLGGHLRNASVKYDDAAKRMDKFQDKLENIQKKEIPLTQEKLEV
ncbi:MAG: DNA recombination protein RmuC [Candidatus Omnitrophica bacterium]|nr:DNA recombination protein RmuC [Candidatus Omnitrophota bacterium]MDD5236737.1 DNA recombination protein RmuC [Candidatus Omnitrophota bacterium]MDD5610298.1 DNA recombination protein RmuC [Candidatus Omnitrophota bacterium]